MNQQQLERRLRAIEARLDKLEGGGAVYGPVDDAEALNQAMTPGSAVQCDTIPAPPVRTTWLSVGKEYGRRLVEVKAGQVLDYYPAQHMQTWEDLAKVVDGYADPQADLGRALDNFFGDPWAQKHGFPPGALLKSFERYRDYTKPAVKPEDEPDPEAINARRIRERREQETIQAVESRTRSASKPPPIEELLSKIGKRF